MGVSVGLQDASARGLAGCLVVTGAGTPERLEVRVDDRLVSLPAYRMA